MTYQMLMVALPFIVMLTFFTMGTPVAFAMGATGVLALAFATGLPTANFYLATVPYSAAANYGLAAIPMFLVMGYVAHASDVTRNLFDLAYKWTGRLPGGLLQGVIWGGALFAAVCGSSLASTAALGSTVLRDLERYNYNKKLMLGVVASTGTLAVMIPPSIAFIIYGILTGVSIGKLLIAGILPGLLSGFMFMAYVAIRAKLDPTLAPTAARFDVADRMRALRQALPSLVLIIIVFGAIYSGFATPTEAAAVGAAGAMAIAVVGRKLSFSEFMEGMNDAVKATSMIFMIIIGAFLFGYYTTLAQIPQDFATFLSGLDVNRWVILGAIILMYLALGTIMDQTAIIILTVPIIFPVIVALGFDPIWWGVILVKTNEIGLMTPPIGLNVYVLKGVSNESLGTIFGGVLPFVLVDVVTLALLIALPQISLFLPSMMG